MQQRHYARHARVGVWGSHALDKKVGRSYNFFGIFLAQIASDPVLFWSFNQTIYFLIIFLSFSVSTNRIWVWWGSVFWTKVCSPSLVRMGPFGSCAPCGLCASASSSASTSVPHVRPHVFWLLMGSLSAYTAPPSKRINWLSQNFDPIKASLSSAKQRPHNLRARWGRTWEVVSELGVEGSVGFAVVDLLTELQTVATSVSFRLGQRRLN